MVVELLKRSVVGVAVGAIVTFIALTILVIFSIESSVQEIWKHFFSSLLIGIYFSVASVIFELERWSLLKQTIIHLIISLIVLFSLFFYAGWIPFEISSILIGLGIFIVTYSIMWFSMYIYFKNLERSMNEYIEGK